jgi:hypothetical protein
MRGSLLFTKPYRKNIRTDFQYSVLGALARTIAALIQQLSCLARIFA